MLLRFLILFLFGNFAHASFQCNFKDISNYDWQPELNEYPVEVTEDKIGNWKSRIDEHPKYPFFLGKSYHLGNGVEVDLGKAKSFYKKSIDLNYAPAKHNLALFGLNPETSEISKSSFDLFCEAAKQGLHFSQATIGAYYIDEKVGVNNVDSAIKWLELASKKNNPFAIDNLIRIFRDSKLKRQNPKLAEKYEVLKANNGSAIYQYLVGSAYFYGLDGYEKNIEKAEFWLKKAVANKEAELNAKNNLGLLYQQKGNQDEAFKWINIAAKEGHIDAVFSLGEYFHYGEGTIIDYDKALEHYKRFIELSKNRKGSNLLLNDAYLKIGAMYALGAGRINRDINEAYIWLKEGFNLDEDDAKNHIYQVHQFINVLAALEKYDELERVVDSVNLTPVKKFISQRGSADYEYYIGSAKIEYGRKDGIAFLEKAAEKSQVDANVELGNIYSGLSNLGVDKDYRQAMYWYKKASNLGSAIAKNNIGRMFHNGEGVEQNLQEAIKWYKEASELNYDLAARNLASVYNVIGDEEKEMFYLNKSAEKSIESMIYLSGLYKEKKQFKKAHEWAFKAAEKFSPEGMYLVGFNYYIGKGVEKDYEKAKYWLAKSIENNPNYRSTDGREWTDLAKDTLRYLYSISENEQEVKIASDFPESDAMKEFYGKEGGNDLKFSTAWEFFKSGKFNKAVDIFTLAAETGHLDSQLMLGQIYSGLYTGYEINFEKARDWFEIALAQQGDKIEALEGLGRIYNTWFESAGKENPIYNVEKAREYLNKAIDLGSVVAINTLILSHTHQKLELNIFGQNKNKTDVRTILSLLKKIIDKNDEFYPPEEQYIKALIVQVENNEYIDNEMLNKGFSELYRLANDGSESHQRQLADIYLTKSSPFYSSEEAFKILKVSSMKSIQANIQLAELYFNAEFYNFYEHGYYLKNAVRLFEMENADDFEFISKRHKDPIIRAYHSLANFYIATDAPMKAEINARKAKRLYGGNADNQHYITNEIILATILKDENFTRELLKNYIRPDVFGDTQIWVSHQNLYSAMLSLHSRLRVQKKYNQSIEILRNFLAYLESTSGNGLTFIPLINLEITRDLISTGNYEEAKKQLKKYEDAVEASTPGFFYKTMFKYMFGSEGGDIAVDLLNNIKNPIELVLHDVISGIIDIKENNFDSGYTKISNALSEVKSKGIPIRAVDLDFSINPILELKKANELSKAKKLLDLVIDLYKFNANFRQQDGISTSVFEKNYIARAVTESITLNRLLNVDNDDKGFELMQLVNGLALSNTVINSLKLENYSGVDYVDRKSINDLEFQRNALISRKLKILEMTPLINEIDATLNQLDDEIIFYKKKMKLTQDKVLNSSITLSEVQSRINDKDAIILTLSSDIGSYIWYVTNAEIHQSFSNLSKGDYASLTDIILKSVEPNSGLNFDINSSVTLYENLVKPFEGFSDDVDRIIFIPDDALSNFPLTLLAKSAVKSSSNDLSYNDTSFRGLGSIESVPNQSVSGQWLIEDYAFSVVPSIKSFVELSKKSSNKKKISKFAGIGNPNLSGNSNVLIRGGSDNSNTTRGNLSRSIKDLAALPETEDELKAISNLFNESIIITKDDATELNIRNKYLFDYDVISFATHALVSQEIKDLYEPALVLTPVNENDKNDDGLFSASEVSELNLNADIVVLSACNTASASDGKNSQGLSGLANSFFNAGAKSLFVSYWSVISDSAVDITTNLFKQLSNNRSYSHSHRESILKILNSKDKSKQHPTYWAPFSVIGIN